MTRTVWSYGPNPGTETRPAECDASECPGDDLTVYACVVARHHVVLGVAVHHVGAVEQPGGVTSRDDGPVEGRSAAGHVVFVIATEHPVGPGVAFHVVVAALAEHDVAVPRLVLVDRCRTLRSAASTAASPSLSNPLSAQSYDVEVRTLPTVEIVVDPVERVGLLGRLRAVALTEHQVAILATSQEVAAARRRVRRVDVEQQDFTVGAEQQPGERCLRVEPRGRPGHCRRR